MLAVTVIAAALLLYFPIAAAATGAAITPRADWMLLAAGMLAQAGLAEELVFRGYLFGHLRPGRTFWRAASAAAVPLVGVHLLLFTTLDPAVAAASIGLAVSMSFPLARLLDDQGEGSIWPPAIVHWVVQAAIKLLVMDADAFPPLAIGWIVWCAVLPWIAFALRPSPPTQGGTGLIRS